MSKLRPLQPGEHRSTKRRASWRRYNALHAPEVKARTARWQRENREHALSKQRAYRLRQNRIKWPLTPVSEQGWSDVKHHYQVTRPMGETMTFKQLGAHFMISPRRIARRSAKERGWSLRCGTAKKAAA